jgi:hypothetical protein
MSQPPEPESAGDPSYPAANPRPADSERGLRGVMSAILVFEAIALLLGLTVIAHGGTNAPTWQVLVIVAIALAHLATPAVIKRPFAVPLIFVLQAIVIGCWAIAAAIGITGIVFLAVWLLIMLMRREFRRRLAAGTMA